MDLEKFMSGLIRRNPGQPEFHQAVFEVAEKVLPFMKANPRYKNMSILERLTEPDRILIFRVCWEDEKGRVKVNRGFRIQWCNAIGPYKGGLRFDKSVNLSILKFLGFEQTLKNALTTLPMGGAKGGSNFNPKFYSECEVMRFCQSYMTELQRHIGKDVDIPAGDIGCGAREISYLFGQYKRIRNIFQGTITGKGLAFGGSPIRTEATGYGNVYFAREMLEHTHDHIEGKACAISGSGNVAQYTAEKLIELGAKVVTMSDSSGFIHIPEGINQEQLDYIMDLKNNKYGRIEDFAKEYKCNYYPDNKPWIIPCELAFPSATQNEIDENDAKALLKNGCKLVSEGANMPTCLKAIKLFQKAKILFGPSKAANAGGVAISGIEMSQNAVGIIWPREEVDKKLKEIMKNIHTQCIEFGSENGYIDYIKGANISGFKKVSDAMVAFGIV